MGKRLLQLSRRLIYLFLSPFRFLGQKTVQIVKAIWDYLSLLGLALRNLLNLLFWKPLLAVTFPIRWAYRKFLKRILITLLRVLARAARSILKDVLIPAVKVAAAISALLFSDLVHFWRLTASWIGKQLSWWRPIFMRKIWALVNAAVSSPVRANRILIAFLIVFVFIALGILPSGESQPDANLSPNLASAQQEEPVRMSFPRPLPDPTATALPAPDHSELELDPAALVNSESNKKDQVRQFLSTVRTASITFSMSQHGNSDIYLLMPGREQPLRLTSHPAEDRDPAWSPDGDRIAFSSKRGGQWDIYVLDVVEDRLTRVTNDAAFDGNPSWSPDGSWLVYESYQGGNLDLYIVDSFGQESPIRITENKDLDFSPVWDPKGRHIAFTSRRFGQQDIFMLPLDGVSDEVAVNITSTPGISEDNASFNPSATFLAYSARQDGYDLVYVHPIDESGSTGEPRIIGRGQHPYWDPEGDALAYIHREEDTSYIVSSTVNAWNTTPQLFSSNSRINELDWSLLKIDPKLERTKQPSSKNQLFVESLSPADPAGSLYLIWPVAIDAPSAFLSDRVNESFEALRNRVIDEAGWDFLGSVDNMFMPLASLVSYGDNFKNWNKAGRAFDFYGRYALSLDPQVEVVREDIGPDTFWRIYLRAENQDGTQGKPLRQLPWDFSARYSSDPKYYDEGGKLKDTIPAGYYVDFTELASDYNWERVPAHHDWRSFFQGTRFWHFENRQGLDWEQAISEIYTEDELARVFDSP